MKILTTVQELKQQRIALDGKVGFVPTMGYLHDGHLSLIDAAKEECTHVFASIFVNPAQFSPNEDLSRYPRDFERDRLLLEQKNVDFLFFPTETEMYPEGYQTYVEVREISRELCGRSRPDHFRGVATVVLKLFHIVKPDFAYFGQKDAQQLTVIRRMVRDLDLDLEIRSVPIVRDIDGLALSSRNKYLSAQERLDALILPHSLKKISAKILTGEIGNRRDVNLFFENGIRNRDGLKLDYVEVVNPETMIPLESWSARDGQLLLLAALWVGKTRLIDNIMINLPADLVGVERKST